MTKKPPARSDGDRGGLTSKQLRFVNEYAVDHNAKQAAIRTGYSVRTAEVQGSRLLRNAKVRAAVEAREKAAAEKLEITRDEIARELARCGFANMLDFMRVGADGDPVVDFSALTRQQAAALAEVTVDDYLEGRGEAAREVRRVRFRLADKLSALSNLAKLLGYMREKVDHNVTFDPVEHLAAMHERRLASKKK